MGKHPLTVLYTYWQSVAQDAKQSIPRRRDLDRDRLSAITPKLSILKRNNQNEVTIALVSTEDDALWRRTQAGMNAFDLVSPDMQNNTAKLINTILDMPVGVRMREQRLSSHIKPITIESLLLPVADHNAVVNSIIGCSVILSGSTGQRLIDHLALDYRTLQSLEFIDLGAGLPNISFQAPPKRVSGLPPKPVNWWGRLLGSTLADQPVKARHHERHHERPASKAVYQENSHQEHSS